MDTLFDLLKAAPSVNAKDLQPKKTGDLGTVTKRSPSPEPLQETQTSNKIKKIDDKLIEEPDFQNASMSTPSKFDIKSSLTSPGIRRESMPPPDTNFVTKNINKSRSLSPPKGLLVKPLKVLVERKKIEEFSIGKSFKSNKTSKPNSTAKRQSQENRSSSTLKNGEKSAKKATPTKAQQKLFDSDVIIKPQKLPKFNVKTCKVRLLRQDLSKLQNEFLIKRKDQKKAKNLSPKTINNRKKSSSSSPEKLSPSKRARQTFEKETNRREFFIKLHSFAKTSKSKVKTEKVTKFSPGSIAKRVNAAAAVSSTKPTKFTRTQLIRMYGKRVFCSRVKIERCSHPMMLIFESNARARRLQAKRSKSKNLSVSFREQVEIFGDSSDSEEPEVNQTSDIDLPSTSQAALKSSNSSITSLTATPARLKKVENGKVVDDILLDPSLFVAPTVSSTPYVSPGRKKREKKSFSPLKGDGAPSPRKEQLKLANEKMPPSSLRRLTADEVDEEDDEDDECEYIVPIEIPERRISRTSSTNAIDDNVEKQADEVLQHDSLTAEFSDIVENKTTEQDSSRESFASAVGHPSTGISDELHLDNTTAENTTNGAIDKMDTEQIVTDVAIEPTCAGYRSSVTKEPTELTLDLVSPSQSLNSLNDIVGTIINDVGVNRTNSPKETTKDSESLLSNCISGTEVDNSDRRDSEELAFDEPKLRNTLDNDISLQLFADDDNTANSNFLEANAIKDSEIVDGIVQERIDEISKDKHSGSPNEANTNISSKAKVE
ncbi:uncharacterized protein LOC101455661 [Ceratitis capitata]|uniref:Uncharacterized protein n=1 Tax=Ceratitis capitata TaxID=7213 RepID=W8BCA1_CERCA|nr:uncharacterized protein LOC101455661 [Ceratitis capitata]